MPVTRRRTAALHDGAIPAGTEANDLDSLLTQREAAPVVRLSERTLERHRVAGTGPAYVNLGRRVFYRRRDLAEWIERHVRHNTSETVR
jgi:predicted DNA-binding transcriptional regulator AlpA